MIQWLDELDDLIAAIGLVSERIRNFFRAFSFLAISLFVQCAGVLLAYCLNRKCKRIDGD